MRLPRHSLVLALTSIAVLSGYRAMSAATDAAEADALASAGAWSGQYYSEGMGAPEEERQFDSLEAKRNFYLHDPSIDERVEDYEVDDSGRPVIAEPEEEEVPADEADEKESEGSASHPQAFYYYNRGFLRNASELPPDGKGYTKIFRERDDASNSGGRHFGTRTLIDVIEKVAADFADQFPGRERLQIADMSKRSGGKLGHLSHQNGLEADIVYVRVKPSEQAPIGAFGKNGFKEQFVISTLLRTETYKVYDKKKKKTVKRTRNIYSKPRVSANFDVAANYKLLTMFEKAVSVRNFFMDKVLVREMNRYIVANGLSNDPEAKELVAKMDDWPSHADHFHLRIECQSTDKLCVSGVAARGHAVRSKSKKSSHKSSSKGAPKSPARSATSSAQARKKG